MIIIFHICYTSIEKLHLPPQAWGIDQLNRRFDGLEKKVMKRERLTPRKTIPRRTGTNHNEPQWLQKCELPFLRTGKLTLSNVSNPDLSLIRSRSSMKELNISRCKLESLEGLAYQPNLNVFNAENSSLKSFKNFLSVAHATIYTLKNTPLSQNPNYLIGLLILAEEEKIIVGGKLVGNSWYRKADSYPSYTRELLNAGWDLEYPCPESQVMREICHEYNVQYIEEEDSNAMFETKNDAFPEEEEPANYLEVIDLLMDRHNDVINQASRNFELLDMTDEKFADEIRDLLETKKHYVFQDDGDLDLQIVTAVRALCLHRQPPPSS